MIVMLRLTCYIQGCLNPIEIIVPEGCFLNPSDNAAVVGGNVQTSQRIVDVIFKAFKAASASQGCMNNVTFGQDDWGYYETVAGGAGAVYMIFYVKFGLRSNQNVYFLFQRR